MDAVISSKPKLYLHISRATHFFEWERPEFKKYFKLVDQPKKDVPLLSFGPDVIEQASKLPATKRFAVMFPGFGHNPLHNLENRKLHRRLIKESFEKVFINYGPLEIAYKGLDNVCIYPFSVDVEKVGFKHYRDKIESLLHVSNDGPQKDWRRSEAIMRKTGLKNEVYPPRKPSFYRKEIFLNNTGKIFRKALRLSKKNYLPYGYVSHEKIIKKYHKFDGFVHIADEIKHPKVLDGKYTASLIEAGVTGAILFWHDTFGLGNNLETIFNLPVDVDKAAKEITQIRKSIDVNKHSRLTREEIVDTFNKTVSVKARVEIILKNIK